MLVVPSSRSIGTALLGLAVALGVPVRPAAATNPSADAAGPIAASGTKLFRQGEYARALADFEEAVTLVERGAGDPKLLPVLRFNLARCLEELGRPREAIAAFERYLEAPDSDTARARATERVEALERRYFARIHLECRPSAATLTLNGRPIGPCGQPVGRLEPGVVEVLARRADELSVKQTFTLTAGVETRATLTFGARIRVEAPSGDALQVRVDDAAVAGPPHVVDVDAGPHRVDVRLPDGSSWRREPRLAPGATLVLRPLAADGTSVASAAHPDSVWGTPWPWMAFGGALAAGGLGAWFWSQALDNAHATEVAVDTHNATTDPVTRAEARLAAKDARADAETQRLGAYTLVGGAVLLAGVGAWLVWPHADSETSAVDRIGFGPAGVVWERSW